jgi:hypothetical protein
MRRGGSNVLRPMGGAVLEPAATCVKRAGSDAKGTAVSNQRAWLSGKRAGRIAPTRQRPAPEPDSAARRSADASESLPISRGSWPAHPA